MSSAAMSTRQSQQSHHNHAQHFKNSPIQIEIRLKIDPIHETITMLVTRFYGFQDFIYLKIGSTLSLEILQYRFHTEINYSDQVT